MGVLQKRRQHHYTTRKEWILNAPWLIVLCRSHKPFSSHPTCYFFLSVWHRAEADWWSVYRSDDVWGAIFGLGVSIPCLQSNQTLQHLRWSLLIWNLHLLLFSHISVRAEKLSPSKQAVDVLRAGRPSPWHLFKTHCFCLYKTAVQSRVRCCSMGITWAVSGSAAFMTLSHIIIFHSRSRAAIKMEKICQ